MDADAPKHSPENIDQLGNAYLINFTRGNKFFEVSNHLGNVMLTVTDKRMPVPVSGNPSVIASYTADVATAVDYSPFGMSLPGRIYNNHWQKYRYGFNGKESDNEMYGPYNELDYGMRVYDPRLGRFLSVDPLASKFPWYTPYQYAGNTPIWATDLDGLEPQPTNNGNSEAEKQTTSADIQSTKGPFMEKATKTWYWHKGSQDYGTKSGWYEEKEYRQMTWPIAADLAGYSDMYSTVATKDNWSDERKQAVANSRLGQFFSSGISEESVKTLLSNAYSVARNRNAISFGMTEFAPINVESVIGLGQMAKGIASSLAKGSSRLAGFGSDAAITENTANLISKRGWYDVVVHGTKDGKGFIMNGKPLSAQQLYENMLANGYQQGSKIRLMSCYSGSLPDGAAYQLSKLANAPVVAPSSSMWITNGQGFLPAGKLMVENGGWFKLFK